MLRRLLFLLFALGAIGGFASELAGGHGHGCRWHERAAADPPPPAP
jgi:hypothetical protein